MRFAVPSRNIRLAGRQRDIVATEASRDADAGDVASVACTVRSAGAVISARFVIHSAPSYTDLRRRDDRATFRESAPCNGSPAAGCPDDHRRGVGAVSLCGGEASRATSAKWRFADGRVLRWMGACLISAPAEACRRWKRRRGSPFVLVGFVLISFSLPF